MNKIVAIHQPNFFPWLGYFDKIFRADVFIFLDDVQFPKTGGVWINRVKMCINGEERWLTAPVERSFHGTRNVNQMFFSRKEDWRAKMLKTLTIANRRAPYFDEAYSIIDPLIKHQEDNIAEFNIYAIKNLTALLGYSDIPLIRSSELSTKLLSNERLIDLTMLVGGKSYLCGGGAGGYQKDDLFQKAGISLIYQNFLHPTYIQFGQKDFVKGLSIVDALMHIGLEGVQVLMRKND